MTVNQFMAALVLAIGKEAQLTEPELVKIVSFYKTPDGRVEYREFCDMLENGKKTLLMKFFFLLNHLCL